MIDVDTRLSRPEDWVNKVTKQAASLPAGCPRMGSCEILTFFFEQSAITIIFKKFPKLSTFLRIFAFFCQNCAQNNQNISRFYEIAINALEIFNKILDKIKESLNPLFLNVLVWRPRRRIFLFLAIFSVNFGAISFVGRTDFFIFEPKICVI